MVDDGPQAAGVQVAEFIKASNVPVKFAKINAPSALENEYDQDMPRVILLNENLPPNPQVLGPLLAREASKLMYETMLDTAERQYMRRSLEVRVWIELGGDPFSLPVIDGPSNYRSEDQAAAYRVWLNNGSRWRLSSSARKPGPTSSRFWRTKSPRNQKRAPGDQVLEVLEMLKAKLENDNKTFTEFLMAESAWKRSIHSDSNKC